jgi:hypothetical protein
VGPSGSGVPFHLDPRGTSAWNSIIHGKKRYSDGVVLLLFFFLFCFLLFFCFFFFFVIGKLILIAFDLLVVGLSIHPKCILQVLARITKIIIMPRLRLSGT